MNVEQAPHGARVNFINCFGPLRLTLAPCSLRPTFEKLFTGAKARRKAQKLGARRKRWAQGEKPFMKSTTGLVNVVDVIF